MSDPLRSGVVCPAPQVHERGQRGVAVDLVGQKERL